jgi:hypothetical protein
MTSLQFLSYLIEFYGMYGVFALVMLEGDLTLFAGRGSGPQWIL